MEKHLFKRLERINIRSIVFGSLSIYGFAAQQKLKQTRRQIKILSKMRLYVQFHCWQLNTTTC